MAFVSEAADGEERVKAVPGLDWSVVFELAPTAMSVVDPHGRQLVGNRAYAELLGYRPDEIEAIDVGTVSRPEDREWSAGYLARLATGAIDEYQTVKRFVRADGGEVTARLHARAIRSADGRCLALIGTLTPTAVRSGIDDARLRRVLSYTQSTFTIVDADGSVIDTSGSYQPLLGYPTEFWAERNVFDLLVPESSAAALAFREDLLAHPGELLSIEVQVRAADGSNQILEVTAVNLLADPEVAGVVVSAQNVTEQRTMMAELAERRETAEAVAEARANLLATVSHELRNPLHAVQGIAELLAAESLPSHAAGLAATLAQQISGLAHVTEDLLDTARLDAGSVELSPAACDLRGLVEELVAYGAAIAGDGSVRVLSDIDAGVPDWVMADGQRLRQVLRNLVGNAVKFTPQGSVTIGVVPTTSGVTITVSDTGIGIPANEFDAVLEPFRTGSSAGDRRGAGLGLAIVQRLVAAMGGEIRITSCVGEGTRVEVELPVSTVKPPEMPKPIPIAVERAITVLVVEDSSVNQQLACSQLEYLSMVPLVVDSGEAAIALLSGPEPPHVDVILMDEQLPGMNGTQTAQQLRTLGVPVRAIPIIALTASASSADRESFLDAGLDGFVAKPAQLADIRDAIAAVLSPGRVAASQECPASDSGSEAGGPVDAEVLDRLASEFGNSAIVRTLVQTFLEEFPARRDALLIALGSGDATRAGHAAHTIKSSARLLGAMALGDECEAVERGTTVDIAALDELLVRTHASFVSWLETQGRLETQG
jgi:PAS domain S-box-containing protein